MTITQTDYGLITEQWPGHFQVSQGYENVYLSDGTPVRFYYFQNGDQWFRDMKSEHDFFAYTGKRKLLACVSYPWHVLPAITPEKWNEK
ncbi:hypothetical protein [Enterobacter hormaechei]|uniref:hypothetical protein n=1 Tax=Enterobacter hormaechei TaxID=158836 RepID=UPI0032DBE26E